MNIIKYIIFLIVMFYLNGCKELDDIFNFKYEKENKNYTTSHKVKFQKEDDPKSVLISSKCKYNKKINYMYYETEFDVEEEYNKKIKKLISDPIKKDYKPFWDIRYVNNIEKYIDFNSNINDNILLSTGIDTTNSEQIFIAGSSIISTNPYGNVIETVCTNNNIAGGATINLDYAPEQKIEYAGPQATFNYILNDKNITFPWKNNSGNLMIQAYFNKPIYINFYKNIGASISFGVILKNKKNGNFINYMIGLFAAGDGWENEQTTIKYDPTTNMIHVASAANKYSYFTTLSPKSNSLIKLHSTYGSTDIRDTNIFFRVNISYNNLKNVLNKLKNNPLEELDGIYIGDTPEDWQVTSIYIQYEVEEEKGKALLTGGFKNFEAFISKLPL